MHFKIIYASSYFNQIYSPKKFCKTLLYMTDRNFINNRYARKRVSWDSTKNDHQNQQGSHLQNLSLKQSKPKSSGRKDMRELGELTLTMDMFTKKNLTLNNHNSHNRNQTHRVNPSHEIGKNKNNIPIKQANMSELRQQAQQLRMENQSLREELKIYKDNEGEFKYQMMRLQEQKYSQKQKQIQQMQKMEDKLNKYSQKIKQLYEELIAEKKRSLKNSHRIQNNVMMNSSKHNQSFLNNSKLRITVSPSSSSVDNTNYYKYFEDEGERDYYASFRKTKQIPMGWSLENSQIESTDLPKYYDQYGTIF